MNINPDFKEYLRLKEESLQKQMDAFENCRQAAIFLRDGYDPKDENSAKPSKANSLYSMKIFIKLWNPRSNKANRQTISLRKAQEEKISKT